MKDHNIGYLLLILLMAGMMGAGYAFGYQDGWDDGLQAALDVVDAEMKSMLWEQP